MFLFRKRNTPLCIDLISRESEWNLNRHPRSNSDWIGEFPGSSVVWTWRFHCWGSIPGQGNPASWVAHKGEKKVWTEWALIHLQFASKLCHEINVMTRLHRGCNWCLSFLPEVWEPSKGFWGWASSRSLCVVEPPSFTEIAPCKAASSPIPCFSAPWIRVFLLYLAKPRSGQAKGNNLGFLGCGLDQGSAPCET